MNESHGASFLHGAFVKTSLGMLSLGTLAIAFFAGKCASPWLHSALPVRLLLAVEAEVDSSTVIPLLEIVAPLTTNLIRLHSVSCRLVYPPFGGDCHHTSVAQ